MTTSSEDVLLQMGEVRYKKGDGTLYVMNERLAWMAEHRDTVTVSHKFADIKMQKISPEGKPKVQLQVVLHDGNCSTFHFVNRNGLQAMLEDRDKVKELLQELLPNFKRKIDKDLEEKNRLLTENPNLLQLYKDLVIPKVMSSDQFWNSYAKKYTSKQNNVKQDIGVSGAFLVDIKPQTDGCNGLKYNLTSDIIHCIFKTYPAVKLKHAENVPKNMSEPDFWTKFFQSHYFHRDRLPGVTKDIFTECGKIDDQNLKADVQRSAGDPLLDLRQLGDVPIEEGYCSSSTETRSSIGGNIVHQNMIKRFNQHSIMVMKTFTDVINSDRASGPVPHNNFSQDSTNDKAKSKESKYNNGNSNGKPESPTLYSKRKRILDKIVYEDLGKPLIQNNDDEDQSNINEPLILHNIERYFQGPKNNSNYAEPFEDPRHLENVQHQLLSITDTWMQRTSHKKLITPTAAVNALGELSPGGALMRGFQDQSIGQLVPDDIENEIRSLYYAVSEILKEFWRNTPPISPDMEEKFTNMHDTLQRFKAVKLRPFENRAMRELSPLGASRTQHLNSLLQAAFNKYNVWRTHKMRQKR